MRLSIAFSAVAGGLALGWATAIWAASPPVAAPPAAPIFYCPTPLASGAAPAQASAHVQSGSACPGAHHVAVTTHHPRHREQLVSRDHEHGALPQPHHGTGTGHMFWRRYEDALNQLGPSCPTWGHPCPPEPPYPIVRESPAPGGYAGARPSRYGPQPFPAEPPCHRAHHGCPPQGGDAWAEAPLPPAAPPASAHDAWRHDQRRFDDRAYAAAPPPPPPIAPPHFRAPLPPHDAYRGGDDYRGSNGDRAGPPIYAYRENRGQDHQGSSYQRSEDSSGWSYSEEDGHGQAQHWDSRDGRWHVDGDGRWTDRDGRRPPPCPNARGCGGDPPAFADGSAQWRDGSYGQVYEASGRDAHGYLVWPGKTDQPGR